MPPHLRGNNKAVPANFKSKLHEDDEKPDSKLKIKSVADKKGNDPAAEKEKKIKNLKKVI